MLNSRPPVRPRTVRRRVVTVIVLLLGVVVVTAVGLDHQPRTDTVELAPPPTTVPWPTRGQASIWVSGGDLVSSKRQRPVPIASVAKIMTALVVLEEHPLAATDDGFSITIGPGDVAATELARSRGESLVEVRDGEVISQRDALLALMLPSANNMARILAVRTAGSETAFVDRMNARARTLGLSGTYYANASGFSARTTSTARDQTRLGAVAMRNPTFAWLVRQPTATIPVAGRIDTTDHLLGQEGFVGIKTGSHRAAGGCFVFAVHRRIDGRSRLIVGAVLGQRGPDLTQAAFDATQVLVDGVSRR